MKKLYTRKGEEILVDDDVWEWASKYRWNTNKGGYIGRGIRIGNKTTTIVLAREIMGLPVGLVVDHINHNILDNQRSNLRVVTIKGNNRNRNLSKTGSKGVHKMRGCKHFPYVARITTDKGRIFLGTFRTRKEAADAYDKSCVKEHGIFSLLNNLKNDPSEPHTLMGARNKSGYRGVFLYKKKTNLWTAVIQKKGFKWQKYFHSRDLAALAYNQKAIEIYGDRAILNKINTQ